MASRAFGTVNEILSAGENSSNKRKSTIFNEIYRDVQNLSTANPVKDNGYTYNDNTIVKYNCDISYGIVSLSQSFSQNYELLTDVKTGSEICNPMTSGNNNYVNGCVNLPVINFAQLDTTPISKKSGPTGSVLYSDGNGGYLGGTGCRALYA